VTTEQQQAGFLPDAAPSGSTSAWFRPTLVACVAAGLVVRLLFVSLVRFPRIANDATFFRQVGANLAAGRGFDSTSVLHPGHLAATASHPPLFPVLLSIFDLLGLTSVTAQRVALAVVGCTAVLVMGLLGRRVAGPGVGVVAAGIAALDPFWLQPIGTLMSESIYLILIPLVLLLALRCWERPTPWRFVIFGVVIGLAVLTRSEAIALVVLLGVPVVLLASVPWKQRGLLALVLLIGLSLMLGPWLIRNEVQVGGAVLSDQEGVTLAGAYCDETFDPHNATFGSFSGFCADAIAAYFFKSVKPPDPATGWTEVSLDHTLTTFSENFARSHLGDLPRVVLAREASTWGLGNQGFQLDLRVSGGRNRPYEQIGGVLYWISTPFVLVGLATLFIRSRRRLLVLAMPVVLVVLNVALTYGDTRFRVAAEPTLAVLAAVGGAAIVGWIKSTLAPDARHRAEFAVELAPPVPQANTPDGISP